MTDLHATAPRANGWPRSVAGQAVKLVCSCVRDPAALLARATTLASRDPAPRDGDLAIVRCLDGAGAYDHVEDTTGAAVKLYRGDVIVTVLGTRHSGTNLFGEVPRHALAAGDHIDLVAQGGLVANCVTAPGYYGGKALPLEIVAFPAGAGGRVLNIADTPVVAPRTRRRPRGRATVLFVCGTSAEVGKTTLVCNLNIAIKAVRPTLRTAAVKACGTGRARDCLHYRAANYDVVVDFVDCGMASTYGVGAAPFRDMLATLIEHCEEHADLVVVELGGDFLEAQAPEALAMMAELDAHCVMLVNDAMGAMEGLRQLAALGRAPLAIGTFRQNPRALADRLGIPMETIIDPGDAAALRRLARRLQGVAVA